MTGKEFKERIKEYRDISRGIKDLKKRIRILEEKRQIVKDSVKGSSSEFPFVQQTCVVEGLEENEQLKRRKKVLKKKQKELEKVKEEMELYINTMIKDERIRQILEYRYIDGFSWVKIASKMNGTEDGVRMEHKRLFEKI